MDTSKMETSKPAAGQSGDLRDFSGLILLVGAGKMGGALVDGWLGAGLEPEKVAVIEPNPSPHIAALGSRGVRLNPDTTASVNADAIVIAVKPQTAAEAMPAIAPMVGPSTLVVSIMAGRTLRFLAGALKQAGAIVRAMPNTPASIGRGITVACPNGKVSASQRKLAGDLLAATGTVEWVDDEALMDAVTAVSGSGPAYVFLLAEALAEAAVTAGLPSSLAETLARETIAGSGELLHRSALPPATLRENVTSPGGTTAAALEVLMGHEALTALMTKAVAAATARSRKLAG
jgi:pyrroline-5-carboxylate reductase